MLKWGEREREGEREGERWREMERERGREMERDGEREGERENRPYSGGDREGHVGMWLKTHLSTTIDLRAGDR